MKMSVELKMIWVVRNTLPDITQVPVSNLKSEKMSVLCSQPDPAAPMWHEDVHYQLLVQFGHMWCATLIVNLQFYVDLLLLPVESKRVKEWKHRQCHSATATHIVVKCGIVSVWVLFWELHIIELYNPVMTEKRTPCLFITFTVLL